MMNKSCCLEPELSERRRARRISLAVDICMALAIMVMSGVMIWHYVIYVPCRVEADCRGQGIQAGSLKQWEERGSGEALGITGLAGWRTEDPQTVKSVSTGRQQRTLVISVYGKMELVMSSKVLSGRCGMDVEENYCVLSEGLAGHLFGSAEVAGECVKMDGQRYIVAGVVESDEDILMIPMKEGKVERIAVAFKRRIGAQENMRQVMEAVRGY